jgi:hypothetical protein
VEPKKRSLGATERDEFLRAAWHALVAEEVDADRLVFVDEMGSNVSLSPTYAWSRKGKRALGSAPRNWRKDVTLCLRASPAEAPDPAWQWRVLPPGRSSGPTWSTSWHRPSRPGRWW